MHGDACYFSFKRKVTKRKLCKIFLDMFAHVSPFRVILSGGRSPKSNILTKIFVKMQEPKARRDLGWNFAKPFLGKNIFFERKSYQIVIVDPFVADAPWFCSLTSLRLAKLRLRFTPLRMTPLNEIRANKAKNHLNKKYPKTRMPSMMR